MGKSMMRGEHWLILISILKRPATCSVGTCKVWVVHTWEHLRSCTKFESKIIIIISFEPRHRISIMEESAATVKSLHLVFFPRLSKAHCAILHGMSYTTLRLAGYSQQFVLRTRSLPHTLCVSIAQVP